MPASFPGNFPGYFYDAQGELLWTSVLALAFAVAFFVGGATRIVEFQGLGFSSGKRATLSVFHLAGCLLFSAALAMLALDPTREHTPLSFAFFGSGVILLFPLHIYVALVRRARQPR